MGYRAYHQTSRTIWRDNAEDSKFQELIEDGCNYAEIISRHYISSAYSPSVEDSPIAALENFMSELDTSRDVHDELAEINNSQIDEFISYIREQYAEYERKEEINVVVEIMEEIKGREDFEYHYINFI